MKSTLSEREAEILSFASKGYTDDMIAQALGIGTGTVNSYWVRIRGKLGHHSRTHLVAKYVQANADVNIGAASQAREEAAADVARGNEQAMADERAKHRQEMADEQVLRSDMEREHANVLAMAEAEIERLKDLLKNKDLS